ncbi:uncharacterized protein TM35_000081050 [Trypanosoma theileri]|uniref:CUE domain-containing protein n=1 Tax=Trypanosoma theileri TaxID=67003 RepID=A0A1X0P037_9TRYP|nr:uncharacterized protein TM35_000081050 [Trypanosoma theileri]ORC90307.1 hypothetical protein TM35_000081050 [Trypanosoma theileri]
MSKTLQETFPDPDEAICSFFLQTTDVSDKTWHSISLIAESDDDTFWVVIAHHKNLSLALKNLITAVDIAHSSAFRRSLQLADEFALITLIVRLVTTTSVVFKRGVSVREVAARFGDLIPASLILPTSLMLLRHSGPIASATITSLFLLNPAYLCAMSTVASSWCDATSRLAVRSVRELSRGRHQRLAGDVVPLFEQVYRHVKHLWALFHSAPFVADYVPLSRLLQNLRVVVDLLSPILQHFILTCSTISNCRDRFSRANSAIVNAAINTASILVLFRTYNKVLTKERCYCVEGIVHSTYEALTSYITQKVSGPPALLLSNSKLSLTLLIHELFPPRMDENDLMVGKVLRSLTEPIPDSKDFSDGFLGSRSRYFELILIELVHQGFHIDRLLDKKFITALEAEELGASERSITCAITGIIEECTKQSNTTSLSNMNDNNNKQEDIVSPPRSSDVEGTTNPLVNIVLDVMPHFNVKGIIAALQYYNNDVEHFILDASMDNIVPHILTQLTEPSPTVVSSNQTTTEKVISETPLAPIHAITSADYDKDYGEVDLNLFIGSDLYEAINGDDDNDNNGEKTLGEDLSSALAYTTHHVEDHRSAAEMFEVDDTMRDNIRMLMEMMYDDEYDDAQDLAEVRGYEARRGTNNSDTSLSDNDDNKDNNDTPDGDNKNSEGTELSRAPHQGVSRARTLYDEKKFHKTRSKQREKDVKSVKEAREKTPSYTQKKKTVRKNAQDKMAFTRAVKKGKSDW